MAWERNASPQAGSETPSALRRRAERVRHFAYQITREDDRKRLREYAAELEAEAADAEHGETTHEVVRQNSAGDGIDI
jgi:hypothetical protein